VNPAARCLIIENDPSDDARRLGEWLIEAGLELTVCRAHAGDPVPAEPAGFAAVVVLGGDQHVYPSWDGAPGAPWFPAVEALLRRCVSSDVATLGVCLGAQLLAAAHAGTVEPAAAGPEVGMGLVAKRDAAELDPLFGPLPMLPDVIVWHGDEITELPLGAVLLYSSSRYPHQAFRVGRTGWGVQFHIECDTAMVADWASGDSAVLRAVGVSGDEVVGSVAALQDDVFEVWHPFAYRFAAIARGELAVVQTDRDRPRTGRELPLLRPGH
jgi:GMP synthase-like glutamine amidotransferase